MQATATPQAATPQAVTPPATAPQVVAPSPTTADALKAIQGVPRTAQELAALNAARSQMSDQLVSVRGRRNELARQLREAVPGTDQQGLQNLIAQLDQRISTLEREIDLSGQALIAAPPSLVATTQATTAISSALGIPPGDVAPLAALFMVIVLGPIAFGLGRFFWRRAKVPPRKAHTPETDNRLDRIEQAVDAIAIEVERISEAQRFQTRLMTEGNRALGAGQAPAEPIPVRQREPARVNTPQT